MLLPHWEAIMANHGSRANPIASVPREHPPHPHTDDAGEVVRVLVGYCLKTTGGPLIRSALRSTVTSKRFAILING